MRHVHPSPSSRGDQISLSPPDQFSLSPDSRAQRNPGPGSACRTDTDHAAKGLAEELPRGSRRLLTPRHAAEGAHPEDKPNYSALADRVRHGMPQAEVVYTDDAPKLTQDELAELGLR
jgi:hypothetical protein